MTDAPQAPQQAGQWFYAVSGRQAGPVTVEVLREMLRLGQIPIDTPVWQEGMAQWFPASSMAILTDGLLPPPQAPTTPKQRKQAQIVKNAKVNCITMFVVFLLWLVFTTGTVISMLRGGRVVHVDCIATAGVFGGLFAAIYLPLRWRTIRQLPSAFSILGMVGGFGLIGMLALTVAGAILHHVAGMPLR